MPRQQPLRICLSKMLQGLRVSYNDVTVFGTGDAGGLRSVSTFDIHETHAANGMGWQARMKTKRRDVDARFPGGIQQRRPMVQGDVPTIDSQLQHINPQNENLSQVVRLNQII